MENKMKGKKKCQMCHNIYDFNIMFLLVKIEGGLKVNYIICPDCKFKIKGEKKNATKYRKD
jgi:hypothetical protein